MKSSEKKILVSSPPSSDSRTSTVENEAVSIKPRNFQPVTVASAPVKSTRFGSPSTVNVTLAPLPRYQPPTPCMPAVELLSVKPSGTG